MKRYIKSTSSEINIKNSNVGTYFSFDFTYEGDYNEGKVDSAVYAAFEDDCGLEVYSVEFGTPDYEDIAEYGNKNVAQATVSFYWSNSECTESEIANAIDDELAIIANYGLVGYDCYTI